MKFIVQQAAEAVAEKPVELSIGIGSVDGWAHVKANGRTVLAFRPDGVVVLYPLGAYARDLGFVADSDSYIKISGRIPG